MGNLEVNMSKTTRFGVSLDENLLESFDKLCTRNGYANRSEAIRDLIRKSLVEDTWGKPEEQGAGTLSLVYDHHQSDISKRLTRIQHDDHDCIIATLHVHLDHHNCLEVLILKSEIGRVRDLANRLLSTRGVKHGAFSLTSTGQDI